MSSLKYGQPRRAHIKDQQSNYVWQAHDSSAIKTQEKTTTVTVLRSNTRNLSKNRTFLFPQFRGRRKDPSQVPISSSDVSQKQPMSHPLQGKILRFVST